MAGDRGSGYNAFTLFLIFILLYLSQKGTNASAYSEAGKSVEPEETPEVPLAGKLAVGLSNGDVSEVSEEVEETEQITSDADLGNSFYQPEVMDQISEEELPIEMVEDESEEESIEIVADEDITTEVPPDEVAPPLVSEDYQVAEESNEEIELPISENFSYLGGQMDQAPQVESAIEEANEEPIEEEVVGTDISEEPVLGGQNNLFIKPTVMTDVGVKKQHKGPKISIKFGK